MSKMTGESLPEKAVEHFSIARNESSNAKSVVFALGGIMYALLSIERAIRASARGR
jgi:hypothetical protein